LRLFLPQLDDTFTAVVIDKDHAGRFEGGEAP
jgi:hypothetical protein